MYFLFIAGDSEESIGIWILKYPFPWIKSSGLFAGIPP